MSALPVLGAGGWGTALAVNAARNGPVRLWARRADFARSLAEGRVNAEYLPGVTLPAGLEVTAHLGEAITDAPFALVVVPSVGVPELLAALPRDLGVVLCAKGLAPDGGS